MVQGIDVEYSLNPNYFKVGSAFQIHIGTNDFRIGLLTKYSKNEVTFKILEKGEISDLTLTVDQLRFQDWGLIKMIPDYEDGKFKVDY